MKAVAIIPARGGSKRLPRKNLIDFNGKPILAYTIESALRAELFERIIVSTEDQEIAEVARQFGAKVMDRPWQLATDTAGVVDVCLHVVEEEENKGHLYDILCCLYATSPLRNHDDIIKTVTPVLNKSCDFSIALTHYHFSPHQALVRRDNRLLRPMWPDMIRKRSQEVPEFLVDNGSTYVAYLPAFTDEKTFYGKRLDGYVMPRERSVDIDLPEDLLMAEMFSGIHRS